MKTNLSCAVAALVVSLLCASTATAASTPSDSELDATLSNAASHHPGDSLESFRAIETWVRQSLSDSALRAKIEPGLCRLLGASSTVDARRFACEQLGIIGDDEALPHLAELLGNNQTTALACLGLTTFPRGKADRLLRSALETSTGMARVQIINTLGDRRDNGSTELLAKLGSDKDEKTAEAAIIALGKIGAASAARSLADLRQTAGEQLQPAIAEARLGCAQRLAAGGNRRAAARNRRAAAQTFNELMEPAQPAHIRRGAFAALLRLEGAQAETRIVAVLGGSDLILKPVAITAVRTLPSPDASEHFGKLMNSLPAEEQVWLIDSLAVRGDPAARSAIARSLASHDAEVRKAAISALGQIGDQSAVGALARAAAASDSKPELRAIEGALASLPSGADIDSALVKELENASGEARATLISALAYREGAAANTTLLTETRNAQPAPAIAAFRVLGQTAGPDQIAPLIVTLSHLQNDEVRSEAERAVGQALARVEDASRRSDIVRNALAQAQGPEARISVLGLLPVCGDSASLDALLAAAKDNDESVRTASVHALADWPDSAVWKPLSALYEQPENESFRRLALHGLVRLAGEENSHPNAQLIGHYRQLLAGAKGDADLRLILGALGGAAHPEALSLAAPLLERPAVRAEAEVAVKKIAESIKARYPREAQEALKKLENPAAR